MTKWSSLWENVALAALAAFVGATAADAVPSKAALITAAYASLRAAIGAAIIFLQVRKARREGSS